MITTVEKNNAIQSEQHIIRRKIGKNTFEVIVRFNKKSKDTMTDKILKLIESEVSNV